MNTEDMQVGCIRIEYNDGTWELLDPQKIRLLKDETRIELDLVFSKVKDELNAILATAEEKDGGTELGISVNETVQGQDKVV